ncbi:hypothetical protein [uncultured Thioclava sp.]|uniref:hypothetical protein n=1 Tax=uncultured Thioclava sp. TaxID=473858 RepID=UPI0025D9EC26|nr:hypothetical protein [uncultured Thioclava sp.]
MAMLATLMLLPNEDIKAAPAELSLWLNSKLYREKSSVSGHQCSGFADKSTLEDTLMMKSHASGARITTATRSAMVWMNIRKMSD